MPTLEPFSNLPTPRTPSPSFCGPHAVAWTLGQSPVVDRLLERSPSPLAAAGAVPFAEGPLPAVPWAPAAPPPQEASPAQRRSPALLTEELSAADFDALNHLPIVQAAATAGVSLNTFKRRKAAIHYGPWPYRQQISLVRGLKADDLAGLCRFPVETVAAAMHTNPKHLVHGMHLSLHWDRWPTSTCAPAPRGKSWPPGGSKAHPVPLASRQERLDLGRQTLGLPPPHHPGFDFERFALRFAHLPWPAACQAMRLPATALDALLERLAWDRWPTSGARKA